jgi:hypothetical protein
MDRITLDIMESVGVEKIHAPDRLVMSLKERGWIIARRKQFWGMGRVKRGIKGDTRQLDDIELHQTLNQHQHKI